jgi:hypothetical protein
MQYGKFNLTCDNTALGSRNEGRRISGDDDGLEASVDLNSRRAAPHKELGPRDGVKLHEIESSRSHVVEWRSML